MKQPSRIPCRNYLSITAILMASFALFSGSTVYASDNDTSQPVTVYQNVNFGGNSLDVGEGDVSIGDLRASSVGNDRISSIEIAPGYQVVACRNSRFRGRCETFTNSVSDLRTISFNDVISSLRVNKIPSGPATVFEHVNFDGSSLNLGEGDVSIGDLRSSSVGNDRISSIRIEAGYEVLACRNSNFRGRCEVFTSDQSDLRTISFNDVISSLRVSPLAGPSPVTVYQNVNFNGRTLNVVEGDVSIQDLRNSVGNDTISSIRIEPGYEVFACRDSNFRGRCEIFTSSQTDLRTISFNDVISSLRVVKTNQQPVNNPPVASDVSGFFVTSADSILTFPLTDLNSFVTDEDDDALNLSIPANDVVTDNGNGTFSFDPTADFATLPLGESATVSFDYEVSDGQAADTARVSIEITGIFVTPPVNNPPVASNASGGIFATDADNILTLSLTALSSFVTDEDDDALSLLIPANDVVTDNGNGTFSFDPTADFATLLLGETATVSFDYEVSDGQATDTATVTIEITGTFVAPPVNNPPVASNASGGVFVTDADNILTLPLTALGSFVTDEDNDALSLSIPANNVVTDNGDGTFSFDPTTDFATLLLGETATVSFDYEVSDGQATDTATVTITVEGTLEPPPPLEAEDSLLVPVVRFGDSQEFDLLLIARAMNPERDNLPLTITVDAPPGLTPIAGQDGTFTYSPPEEFQALASDQSELVVFDYTISDGDDSASGTFTITVFGSEEQEPALVAPDIEFSTDGNVGVQIAVSDLQPRVRAANGGEALQISILENDALNPVFGIDNVFIFNAREEEAVGRLFSWCQGGGRRFHLLVKLAIRRNYCSAGISS